MTPEDLKPITDDERRIQKAKPTDPPEVIADKIDIALRKALTGESWNKLMSCS